MRPTRRSLLERRHLGACREPTEQDAEDGRRDCAPGEAAADAEPARPGPSQDTEATDRQRDERRAGGDRRSAARTRHPQPDAGPGEEARPDDIRKPAAPTWGR